MVPRNPQSSREKVQVVSRFLSRQGQSITQSAELIVIFVRSQFKVSGSQNIGSKVANGRYGSLDYILQASHHGAAKFLAL